MLGGVWGKGDPPTLVVECEFMRPLWRIVSSFSKKLKVETPYNPAIPWLGIYLEKTVICKCTPMFLAALFTVAKSWKQPKYPSTEEGIEGCVCVCVYIVYVYIVCIYTIEHYSAIKRMK